MLGGLNLDIYKKFDPLKYGTPSMVIKKNAVKKLLLCGLIGKEPQ
jgi:hypothetical protein